MLVGSQEEATFIHDWYHEVGGYSRGTTAPEGWKYLNSGFFRAAYLSPSGVVYKVQKNLFSSRYQTNQSEWETWKRLYIGCKMPRYSRLPKIGYFPTEGGVGVIAIERFSKPYRYLESFEDDSGIPIYWSDVASDISSRCQVGDLYGNNLFIDDENNLLVPTDLGDTW